MTVFSHNEKGMIPKSFTRGYAIKLQSVDVYHLLRDILRKSDACKGSYRYPDREVDYVSPQNDFLLVDGTSPM